MQHLVRGDTGLMPIVSPVAEVARRLNIGEHGIEHADIDAGESYSRLLMGEYFQSQYRAWWTRYGMQVSL